jgi:hypothetical protein
METPKQTKFAQDDTNFTEMLKQLPKLPNYSFSQKVTSFHDNASPYADNKVL